MNYIVKIVLGGVALLLGLTACRIGPSPSTKHERDYQQEWCAQQQGQAEYRLDDATRVDCLTSSHAVEFDFGHKWAEAIGQALYYGLKTNKRPGIVLIFHPQKEKRYWERLQEIIAHHHLAIDVWKMER